MFLINTRNEKMKSRAHPALSIHELNQQQKDAISAGLK